MFAFWKSTGALHAEKNSASRPEQYFLLFFKKDVLVNYCALMRKSGADSDEFRTLDTQLCLNLQTQKSSACILGKIYWIFASI